MIILFKKIEEMDAVYIYNQKELQELSMITFETRRALKLNVRKFAKQLHVKKREIENVELCYSSSTDCVRYLYEFIYYNELLSKQLREELINRLRVGFIDYICDCVCAGFA